MVVPVGADVVEPRLSVGVTPEWMEVKERGLQHWGTLEGARAWAEAAAIFGGALTEEEIHFHAKLARHAGTPHVGRRMMKIWLETDIRPVLPSVKVPALLWAMELTRSRSRRPSTSSR